MCLRRCTSSARRSLGDRLGVVWKVGRRRIIVLPVFIIPEVVFSVHTVDDRPLKPIEVEYELVVEESIAAITDAIPLPVSSASSFDGRFAYGDVGIASGIASGRLRSR